MKKLVMLLVLFLIGLSAGPSFAQDRPDDKPPKWGEIPQEHLEMNVYAPDSNAAVVILSDYGNLYFNDDLEMIFERHTRIKILSEAGYDWGTVSIPYVAECKMQQVKDIKGRTYLAAEGGRVEMHEMKKGAIFKEDVDGIWKQVRFTLPALQPGAVIEYRYKINSLDPRYFADWAFQKSEPVLRSEYRAEIPEIYRYVTLFKGRQQPDVAEQKPYSRTMRWTITLSESRPFGARSFGALHASTEVEGTKYRWVMREVLALRREPFMTTPEDFRAKIRFELAEIGQPSAQMVQITYQGETMDIPASQLPVTPVMTSWNQLAAELMDSKHFGKQVGRHRAVREQAQAVVDGLSDPREKMQAIYDYLRTTMAWTGQRGVIPGRDLDDALAARSADSPEIALLLVSMLREVGLEAHPALISTRSHGQIWHLYPLLSHFNDVLAYVEIDSVGYVLDATDPLRPHTLLPHEALNSSGFLVRHPNPTWVDLLPAEPYRHQRFLNATLDASGQLNGTIQASDGGYSALDNRRALKDAESPDAFVQGVLLDGLDEAIIDSCSVINEEKVAEQLKTEATFSAPAYAQVAGDFIYFNPTPLGRLGENPLRLPERAFPVDLAYPRQRVYTFQLKLPEGYAVQEAPQSVRFLLPEGGGMYQRLIQVQGDVLSIQSQFVIKRTVFEPERYEQLRSFFEQVVATEVEQVVLKRI